MYRRAKQSDSDMTSGNGCVESKIDEKKRGLHRRTLKCFGYLKSKRLRLIYAILSIFLIVNSILLPREIAVSPNQHGALKPLADDVKVSVVVMNHNRPRMVRESSMMETFARHPAVNEILLCHSNPETQFEYEHPKVKNIDAVEANEKMGLSLRFHYCTEAQNRWVIQVDDDMEPSPEAITVMLQHFSQDSKRIVGFYGRAFSYWKSFLRNGYDTKTLFGPVEVVLTKLMVLERDLCKEFFTYENLVEDLVPAGKPLWNGEDIFMSLVANAVYGVPVGGPYRNFAIKELRIGEASDDLKDDDTGAHDVSGNLNRHLIMNVGPFHWWSAIVKANRHCAFRGTLWSTARRRLAATMRK